jgi:GTPase SAR1 family protein
MQQEQCALYLIGLQARGKSTFFSEVFQNKQTNKQTRKITEKNRTIKRISDLTTLKRNAENSSSSMHFT